MLTPTFPPFALVLVFSFILSSGSLAEVYSASGPTTLVKYSPPGGGTPRDFQNDYERELKLQKALQDARFVQMCTAMRREMELAADAYVTALNNLIASKEDLQRSTQMVGVLSNSARGIRYSPATVSDEQYFELGERFLQTAGAMAFSTDNIGQLCRTHTCHLSEAEFDDLVDRVFLDHPVNEYVLENLRLSLNELLLKTYTHGKAMDKEKATFQVLARLVAEYMEKRCAFGYSTRELIEKLIEEAQNRNAQPPMPPALR